MTDSKYIPGVTVPAFDQEVTTILAEVIDGGGKRMITAIENFDREIYRVVATQGLGAYMDVVYALANLGLKDTLANKPGTKGYDSWFVVTDEFVKYYETPEPAIPDAVTDILAEIESIPATEREAVLKSRIGQGVFRERLIAYWRGCAVTGGECIPLLRASHIKPWRDCSNEERLDPYNGLLLTPNLDAAFDRGYISFDESGKILLSSKMTGAPAFQLHVTQKLKLNAKLVTEQHKKYLQYHRENVFLG